MHPPRILAVLLLLTAAVARAATLDEVLPRLRAARNTADFTASARLVDVAASGERQSHAITGKAGASKAIGFDRASFGRNSTESPRAQGWMSTAQGASCGSLSMSGHRA